LEFASFHPDFFTDLACRAFFEGFPLVTRPGRELEKIGLRRMAILSYEEQILFIINRDTTTEPPRSTISSFVSRPSAFWAYPVDLEMHAPAIKSLI
jgi:hypothetical protein